MKFPARFLAALFAVICASSPTPAQEPPGGGLTPYTVDLLRSNVEDETISDIEWRDGTVPVYVLAGEGGSPVPLARIEADLKHRDWSFFWNNSLVRSGQSTDPLFVLEVPLQGEYTQVELFGSRNVVQLEREVLVLHFPKWKEAQLAMNLMQKRDDELPPGKIGTRVLAAAGPELLRQGDVGSVAVSVQLHAHSGLGESGRFRLGAQAWLTGAVVHMVNTTESFRRTSLEPFLGYVLGSRTRISLLAGASILTMSLSETRVGATVTGAFVTPSFQFLLGRGMEFSFLPRAAFYPGVPDGTDAWIEAGGQLQLKLGQRDRGGFSLVGDVRMLDSGAADNILTVFGGLGYSL